ESFRARDPGTVAGYASDRTPVAFRFRPSPSPASPDRVPFARSRVAESYTSRKHDLRKVHISAVRFDLTGMPDGDRSRSQRHVAFRDEAQHVLVARARSLLRYWSYDNCTQSPETNSGALDPCLGRATTEGGRQARHRWS